MAKRPTQDRDDQPTATNPSETVTTSGPRELPLVALARPSSFPEMIVPLQVGREKSVNALNAAVAEGGPIALVTQRQPEQEDIESPSSCTPSAPLPRSPRSSSSRTAPSGRSSRVRAGCD